MAASPNCSTAMRGLFINKGQEMGLIVRLSCEALDQSLVLQG